MLSPPLPLLDDSILFLRTRTVATATATATGQGKVIPDLLWSKGVWGGGEAR